MATVDDVSRAHTAGLNHIDALLDEGPAWNFVTPASNRLTYTFSVSSGLEEGNSSVRGANQVFSMEQQTATRTMLAYISSVTGIEFVETADGQTATFHFSMRDIVASSTAGLCSWSSSYNFDGQNQITSYSAKAYIYLDSVEWGEQNSNLTAGGNGYETLLHEMGHGLGLKHSFEGNTRLPTNEDNTSNTLMSYTDQGGPYSTFRPYDLAALYWLYGGDGLAGTAGVNSAGGRILYGSGAAETLTTGTGNDTVQGMGGDDIINTGSGFDTAIYNAARAGFTLAVNNGTVSLQDISDALGTDTLTGVERIKFSDLTVAFDTDGNAGRAYRLYQAAFDRAPDSGGLGFWIKVLENGASLTEVAGGFVNSQEFINLYGANASNTAIVTKLYNNVLHRAPEQGGFDFWVNILNQGHPVKDVLAAFSESPENQAQVIGTIQNGMTYTPFV